MERQRSRDLSKADVRFGSLADMSAALQNIGFIPEADIIENRRHVA